jgi:hypothetical protein
MTDEKPIHQRALLASLNISQWQARKRDKKVTSAVVSQNDAKHGAGNFNKSLLQRDSLAGIVSVVSEARDLHATMTLGWGDNNDRIMPASLYPTYKAKMDALENRFEACVLDFVRNYPDYVQQARRELGKMYDPQDYPDASVVRDKFDFRISVMPLATADDFRVSLSTEHVDQIKRQIAADYEQRQQRMVRECFERAKDVVKRISERCNDKDGKIYESLMGNARDFVSLLPALNINNDPVLAQLGLDIDALLVPTDRLKKDKGLRRKVADQADDILSRMNW